MNSSPEASTTNALCVTGMHRSGTSLAASWLARCGLTIHDGRLLGAGPGNAYGHFEDLDFFDIERLVLLRHHYRVCGSWQVARARTFTFNDAELAQARALIAARDQRFPRWGWKDPRALLFLPQWKRLLPQLKVLIVWRPCVEVVASLRERAKRAPENTDLAIGAYKAARVWKAHNRMALQFKQAHPRDVLLVSVRTLLAMDQQVIEHCNRAWQLGLSHVPSSELRDANMLQPRTSAESRIAARLVGAHQLERALEASSDALPYAGAAARP